MNQARVRMRMTPSQTARITILDCPLVRVFMSDFQFSTSTELIERRLRRPWSAKGKCHRRLDASTAENHEPDAAGVCGYDFPSLSNQGIELLFDGRPVYGTPPFCR